MKRFLRDLLQDLKPFLWYLLAGVAFTLMMWLARGGQKPTGQGPGYWDEDDLAGQMVEEQFQEEINADRHQREMRTDSLVQED